MYWVKAELRFRVHLKENQKLKYLNRGSQHTHHCFRSIPSSQIRRWALLTSRTEQNEGTRMNILYPKHAEALRIAKLAPDIYPTLGEVLDNISKEANGDENGADDEDSDDDSSVSSISSNASGSSESSGSSKDKSKRIRRRRDVHFCIGYSTAWDKPVHAIMTKLQKKHGLKWFKLSMSYKKFSNLREIFQGDLNAKVMEGIVSLDFVARKCNCKSKNEGICSSGPSSDCRLSCVVYKATCRCCDKVYIGNTQQQVKERMGQHYTDVKSLVNKGKKSDTFAAHGAEHYHELGRKASVGMARAMFKVEVLWKGNIISCMKSFGKRSCKLCMKERMAILNMWETEPEKLINSRSEIFGGCRHKTRFHRYQHRPTEQPSTDDGVNPERVMFGYNGKYANWWTNDATSPIDVVVCLPTGGEPANTADV